jgi:serine/threonine protein kinase
MPTIVGIIGALVGLVVFVAVLVAVIVATAKAFGGLFVALGWLFKHVYTFVAGVLGDTVRFFGAVVTLLAFVPLTVLNVVIGRWSAAAHFGRAVQTECFTAGRCLYRVGLGHPLRFLLLGGLTEGLEKRLPAAVAQAPGGDRPGKRTGKFEGYEIVGSLKGGGSGGRLYIAEPDAAKRRELERAGAGDIDQVVIKSFSLADGSSMPQIVRESRALEAARKLGLVVEHQLDDSRFYYVMRFVPGDTLGVVGERLHAAAGPGGLAGEHLSEALGYVGDLLNTLEVYHRGGLWHKDVKPDNIIIHSGKAHLVDLGLVTPLRSAMTLTTHGTEYFRDPEMVRLALRGAKVHEVDGVKFDVYGAGAVLYAVVENSFPAHGGLSQLKKHCPEALRWIIRRSMAETQQRYTSAADMLADLRVVQRAADPFALKPKDLPSMRGAGAQDVELEADPMVMNVAAVGAAGIAASAGSPTPPHFADAPAPPAYRGISTPPREGPALDADGGRERPFGRPSAPRITVHDWLTGAYTYEQPAATPSKAHRATREYGPHAGAAGAGAAGPREPRRAPIIHGAVPADLYPQPHGRAADQRNRARHRAKLTQQRVRDRLKQSGQRYSNKPNSGVYGAGFIALIVVGFVVAMTALEDDQPNVGATAPGAPVSTATLYTADGGDLELRFPSNEHFYSPETPFLASRLEGRPVLITAAPDAQRFLDEQRALWLDRVARRLERDGAAVFTPDGSTEPATIDAEARILAAIDSVGFAASSSERIAAIGDALRDAGANAPAAVVWLGLSAAAEDEPGPALFLAAQRDAWSDVITESLLSSQWSDARSGSLEAGDAPSTPREPAAPQRAPKPTPVGT